MHALPRCVIFISLFRICFVLHVRNTCPYCCDLLKSLFGACVQSFFPRFFWYSVWWQAFFNSFFSFVAPGVVGWLLVDHFSVGDYVKSPALVGSGVATAPDFEDKARASVLEALCWMQQVLKSDHVRCACCAMCPGVCEMAPAEARHLFFLQCSQANSHARLKCAAALCPVACQKIAPSTWSPQCPLKLGYMHVKSYGSDLAQFVRNIVVNWLRCTLKLVHPPQQISFQRSLVLW